MDRIADEIGSVVTRVWELTLSDTIRDMQDTNGTSPEKLQIASRIEISGAWQGVLAIAMSAEFNNKLAQAMFDLGSQSATRSQKEDVVLEMANLFGGNVKTILPEPCELSLPKLVDDFSALLEEARRADDSVKRSFLWNGLPLSVLVFKKE